MWRTFRSKAEEGFTLVEATVSMFLLVVVLVLSLTFLFSMRTFSQRQELFASPRQTARRAIDYVGYYVRGATDMNFRGGNPNAIVTFYQKNSVNVQASYNNVTSAALADPGTDIITLAVPNQGSLNIPILRWVGADLNAANAWIGYAEGCPPPYGPRAGGSDAINDAMFKEITGYDPSTGKSAILTVVDERGNWVYYQITNYQQVDCADGSGEIIHVVANPGQSDGINPPGGPGGTLDPPVSIMGAVRYTCFRVKNNQLQQRWGLFDPTSPDTGFVPLLDNVEDMQIAYIYDDGTVVNNAVPPQVGPSGTPTATDVIHVVGIRLTVTARSDRLPVTLTHRNRFGRPAAEDHAAGGLDDRYHYRLTTTLMVRNRTLGS
jgi:type II secretory pathway component PulJ